MGRADGVWRIVVRIGAGQPELQAALAAVPARARAERLRQLALIGLCRLPQDAERVPRHELAEAPTLQALELTGTRWDVSARRFGLDPRLLYAMALAASARPTGAGALAAWPWTLRLPAGVRFYETQAQALAALRARLKTGATDIGIGLFGIGPETAKSRVGDPATLLDGPTSLVVATGMLAEGIDAAGGDRVLGIGQLRYPKDRRAARAYGRQVLRLQRALSGSAADPSSDVLDRWRASAVLDLVAAPESGGNYSRLP